MNCQRLLNVIKSGVKPLYLQDALRQALPIESVYKAITGAIRLRHMVRAARPAVVTYMILVTIFLDFMTLQRLRLKLVDFNRLTPNCQKTEKCITLTALWLICFCIIPPRIMQLHQALLHV